MTTTVNLRPILDRKQWEICTPAPVIGAAGVCVIPSTRMAIIDNAAASANGGQNNVMALYITGASAMYAWDSREDSYALLPASGIGGTFGAGVCGTWHASGPTGTASAGSGTTITTTTTVLADLTGYAVRITGGAGAGQTRMIQSNTYGANSVLTVATWDTNPDNTSVFLLLTGRFYVLFPAATPGLRYWDHATQAWSGALTVTGLTFTVTDGQLVNTHSTKGVMWPAITTLGPVTAATGTTVSDSGAAWTASQFINMQVRITQGTGAGQVRTITANTSTQLTVATWTVTPDATSKIEIAGNDDYLYFTGNASTSMFRYSISGNSWSAMTVRGGAAAAGVTFDYIARAGGDWTGTSTGATIINGRRIYSLRGGAASTLDYYDIPSNTWTSAIAYGGVAETFTTGASACYDGGEYLYVQKDATGRIFRIALRQTAIEGWSTNLYAQGAAVVGQKLFMVDYVDGATTIKWLHMARNTGTEFFRCLVI